MMEFAMPPISTIPSEDTDDSDGAFKILNQDNLPISVVGEAIFKPFGRHNTSQKPNGIAFPIRRVVGNLDETRQRGFTKSNGCIDDTNEVYQVKDISVSHGNLNHCNSAAKKRPEAVSVPVLNTHFTKVDIATCAYETY